MRIYIGGPMRGIKHQNFPAFDKARDMLKALGYEVINPADMDRLHEGWELYPPDDFIPTRADLIRFMDRDYNALQGCDAIFLLRGWEYSAGTLCELSYARFLGLKVFHQEGFAG